MISKMESSGMSVPEETFHYSEVNQETGVATVTEGPPPSEAPVEMSAEEDAAMRFTKLLPYVTKLSSAMGSKGGLVRVMTALAEFPLGGRQPRLLNESERQLFGVMQELNGYKTTVINSFIKKQADLDAAQKNQTAVSTTAETENNNG